MSLRQPQAFLARAPLRQLQPAYTCKRYPPPLRDAPLVSRSFSSSIGRNADRVTEALLSQKRRSAPQSFRTAKDLQQQLVQTNDYGLLEGTFVRPTGYAMPSLFSNPRLRWAIERAWLWSKFKGYISLSAWVFGVKKPRPRLEFRSLGSRTSTLYMRMYTALAGKDTATLEEICASGLLESCRARISARESNELIHWMKLSNRSRPRIVSDRAVRIPIPDAPEDQLPSVLRQVVVRLHTRQYLIRGFWEGRNLVDATSGEVIPTNTDFSGNIAFPKEMCDAASKDVVEYVVLQKRIWKGEEESWRIWGMTKETDLKRLAQKSAASKLVNRTKAAKA